MAADRLIRLFPARCIITSLEPVDNHVFRNEFAAFLRHLDMERMEVATAKSKKAGVELDETRSSVHPKMVTDLLMSLLAPFASGDEASITVPIQKHVRDDICWNHSKLPWRRSPLWLSIRVAIQTALEGMNIEGRLLYKNFMIFLLSNFSQLLQTAHSPSEILAVAQMKVARRVTKLDLNSSQNQAFMGVLELASKTIEHVRIELETRWKKVQEAERKIVVSLQRENFADGTEMTLLNSKTKLLNIMASSLESEKPLEFSPPGLNRLVVSSKLPKPDFSQFTGNACSLLLSDFERWVALELPIWVEHHQPKDSDCTDLVRLIKGYHIAALQCYEANAEQISLMLLVVVELWVALDKSVVKLYPLLKGYPPEIPRNFLWPLLIPKLSTIGRVETVEFYLQRRYKECHVGNPSLFANPAAESFSTRFYNSSVELQTLRARITDDATKARAAKTEEWRTKDQQYKQWTEEASRLDHDKYTLRRKKNRFVHDEYRCTKCGLNRKADGLSITVHEWPLPDTEVQAKASIFELQCPDGIVSWRDGTWFVLHDVTKHCLKRGSEMFGSVLNYVGLQGYARDQGQQITLGSKTKSFVVSHYSSQSFPVTSKHIFVNNGLQYQTCKSEGSVWTTDQEPTPGLHSLVKVVLPSGRYQTLQFAINSTEHTQNEVLASQNNCSTKLDLHEYIAFGSLRSGNRIQWYNILRELASTNLTFNAPEIVALISTAVWQIGPPSARSNLRDAHFVFTDRGFCVRLLKVVRDSLDAIEANWREQRTMMTLVIILLRTISLTQETATIDESLNLLERCRLTSYRWVGELNQRLHDTVEEEAIIEAQSRVLEATNLCRMTFDVDDCHIDRILGISETENLAILVECSIINYDNRPTNTGHLSRFVRNNIFNDRKLSHRLEERFLKSVQARNDGLDEGISRILAAPLVANPWIFFDDDKKGWCFTQTTKTKMTNSQTVHYNVVSGELLIDGRPLGVLPATYTSDPIYQRVFGPQILKVCPSDNTAMVYKTASKIHGYRAYFGITLYPLSA